MSQKETKKTEPLSIQLQAINIMIKASEHNGIFDSGFSLPDLAQNAEYRGMKGEQLWTAEMLEKVITRFRQHIATHQTEPKDIDALLTLLSTKINVNIDRIRRCFYGIPEPASETVNLFPTEETE